MKLFDKKDILIIIAILILGQIAFAFYSPKFTTPHYEGKIYATTGVTHDASDLHKLNESAHYFGETIIGWTSFPTFLSRLQEFATLPKDSTFNAHMQQRQNMIYTITSSDEITEGQLMRTKDFIQAEIDKYNQKTNTHFMLTNADYERYKVERSYMEGLLMTFIASIIVGLGMVFLKREF